MTSKRFVTTLMLSAACAALSACGGDSTAELANPGNTGANPGTGGNPGGGGGGGGGGPITASCPAQTTVVQVGTEQHCRLPGRILNDLTLVPGNIYQLNSRFDVGASTLETGGGDPATLTILPGVTVYASNQNAYLVVQHGSRIVADGTASQPIIFTSAADLDYDDELGITPLRAAYRGRADQDPNGTTRGEWGGIVINGLAPTNNPTRVGEGSTGVASQGNQIRGGANADDSSGTIRYVQIRYAGFDVGLATGGAAGANELNGLALQAVGRGTLIDFVQVHQGYDDCIEMFGGTVNLRHVICTGTSDDAIDWTDGWTGNLQYGLVVMNGNNITGDAGIEADNLDIDNERLPRSNPVLSNVTIVGTDAAGVTAGGGKALFRQGTAARFLNSVSTGPYNTAALDIDGASSYAQATAGNLIFRSIFLSSGTAFATDSDDATLATLFTAGSGNSSGNTSTLTSAAGGVAYINGANENGVAVFSLTGLGTGTVGALTTPPAIGAVQNAATNWTLGWTEFLNR